ncbi:MAG: hypothetical protein ACOC6D_02995 [Atribacterota bacterium]
MIKIKLVVPKLLSSDQNIKGNTQVLNLEYSNPVMVEQVLKDNNINMHFLGFMVLNGNKNVNKKFLIEESCELKLFLLMAGG